MKQRSEMIADGFKTHGIHHQKSKTRYQFITFYLKKQKEDAYSGGAAR